MATYANLTVNAKDILGDNFDPSRASVWIEANTPHSLIVVDGTNVRVGGRREKPDASGTVVFSNLVTTNSADNPTSFAYRVTILYVPKGSRRQGHDTWTSSDFSFTATGNLAAISEAFDGLAISPTWQSEFRDEMEAIAGLTGEDAAIANRINTPGSDTEDALDAYVGAHPQVTGRVEVREGPLSPYRYGFVGDGTADDTAALQAALNALPASGGEMELPHAGNAKITAPLSITKPLTIRGRSAYNQRLYAVGCNGIEVAAGVSDVRIEGFEIAAASRHSTTPNTLIGIKVNGTTSTRPYNHAYRDLYLDGFGTGFQTRYLWASVFDNTRTDFGKIGLASYGLSVNNFVGGGSQFSTSGGAGSRGIGLYGLESPTDSTDVASEGWIINSALTYGAEIGIELVGVNHVTISDCILDFNTVYGVYVADNGTHFANNIDIHDTYVAIDGIAGSAGIALANGIDNVQRRYARITGNELTVYSGGVCQHGIQLAGTHAQAIIRGNTANRFAATDCFAQASSNNIITDNAFLSTAPSLANIYSELPQVVANNVGTVYRTGAATTTNYERDTLGRKVLRATAAPTSGTWALGDRVIRDIPAVGSPKAWVCTVAGTPGTWVSEGNL